MLSDSNLREILSNAIRFWERARLIYNGVLAAVLVAVYQYCQPASSEHVSLKLFEQMFLGAMGLNVLYTFAYLPDIGAQLSDYRAQWLKYRWILFAAGTTFASILTQLNSTESFLGK